MEDQQKAAYASLANFSKSGEKNKMETTNKNKFSLGNYLWGIGSYEPYEERAKFLKEFETDNCTLCRKLRNLKSSMNLFARSKIISTLTSGAALGTFTFSDNYDLVSMVLFGISEGTRYVVNRIEKEDIQHFDYMRGKRLELELAKEDTERTMIHNRKVLDDLSDRVDDFLGNSGNYSNKDDKEDDDWCPYDDPNQ